jgi:hypothetical protein
MSNDAYDLIVVGGGPGGEACAAHAARAGARVVLVERDRVGGECPYWGCMPSKALVRPPQAVAEVLRTPGAAEALTGALDVDAAFERRDEVVRHLDDSSHAERIEKHGIEIVRGHGRLDGERRVRVELNEGGERTLTVVGCDINPEFGTITTSVDGVADPAASVNVVPYLDLRRRVGSAIVRPSMRDSGMAQVTTTRACTDATDNGTTSEPVPADSLVHGVTTAPKRFPVHQLPSGVWVGGGTQTVSPGDIAGFAPQVQAVTLRLAGTPPTLNALCFIPTAFQLRFVRTQRAAVAFATSAGFPRPWVERAPSRTVPAGRYFVREQSAHTRFLGCGPAGIHVVLSTGPRR